MGLPLNPLRAGAQVLPLVPPEEEFWSPYTGLDALCGNTLMIALDALVGAGLLDAADVPPKRPTADADFAHVSAAAVCSCVQAS